MPTRRRGEAVIGTFDRCVSSKTTMKLILRTLTVVALVGLTTVWLWAEQEPALDVIVT